MNPTTEVRVAVALTKGELLDMKIALEAHRLRLPNPDREHLMALIRKCDAALATLTTRDEWWRGIPPSGQVDPEVDIAVR